jgi:hypothetical protein
VTQNHAPSIELNALLIGKNKTAAAKALVDSGATGNLINRKFVAKHQMTPHVLKTPTVGCKNDQVFDTFGMIIFQHEFLGHVTLCPAYFIHICFLAIRITSNHVIWSIFDGCRSSGKAAPLNKQMKITPTY